MPSEAVGCTEASGAATPHQVPSYGTAQHKTDVPDLVEQGAVALLELFKREVQGTGSGTT